MCLRLYQVDLRLDVRAGTHETKQMFSVLAETMPVRTEGEGVLPTCKDTGHDENRTVAVDGALLVKHLEGDLGVVNDHHRLTQRIDIDDTPY